MSFVKKNDRNLLRNNQNNKNEQEIDSDRKSMGYIY